MNEIIPLLHNWWDNEMTTPLFDLKPFQVRRIAGACQLISGCIVLIDILGVTWFSRQGQNLISIAQFFRRYGKRLIIGTVAILIIFYYYSLFTTREIGNIFDYNQPDVDSFMKSNFVLVILFPITFAFMGITFHRNYTYSLMVNGLNGVGRFMTHHKFKEIAVVLSFIMLLLSSIVAIIYA